MSYISTNCSVALVNTISSAKVFVLPPARQVPGQLLYMKDLNFNAFYSTIFVSTSGFDTIENQRNTNVTQYAPLSTSGGALLLASDGNTNWMILQHYILNTVSIAGNPQQFLYNGTFQSYTVPVSARRLFVQMWGAGGGGISGGVGGAGAYVEGAFAVTPGQIYEIIVGRGGQSPWTAAKSLVDGNGGNGGNGGAAGGGFSAIRLNGVYIVIIAGGGGASSSPYVGGAGSFNGTGGNGTAPFGGGQGGSLTAGGTPGTFPGQFTAEAGSLYAGGNGSASASSGGGGGGLYGGGGSTGGGAGGGSSLITNLTSVVGFNSTGSAPVNTGSSRYVTGISSGGNNTSGGNGLVWISAL